MESPEAPAGELVDEEAAAATLRLLHPLLLPAAPARRGRRGVVRVRATVRRRGRARRGRRRPVSSREKPEAGAADSPELSGDGPVPVLILPAIDLIGGKCV